MFSIHQEIKELNLFIKDNVDNSVPFIIIPSGWDVGEAQDKGQIGGKVRRG